MRTNTDGIFSKHERHKTASMRDIKIASMRDIKTVSMRDIKTASMRDIRQQV